MENAKKTIGNEKLVLLTDQNKYFSYPKLSTLRALVFNADTNGFAKVIRRINKRVLIKVDAFFDWVEEQNEYPPTNQDDKEVL